MTYFYTENTISIYKRKYKLYLAAALVLAGLSLAAEIILCLCVTTGNAAVMKRAVIITAVFSGWIIIFLLEERILKFRREYIHEEHMLQAETETVEGVVTVSGAVTDITKSISVVSVCVSTGTETRHLNINAMYADELCRVEGPVRLTAAHGYITGCEVLK